MGSLSAEQISDVVGSIYRAAYRPEEWQSVVEGMSDIFDCSRACIVRASGASVMAICSTEDEEFVSAECLAAHLRDPFIAASLAPAVGRIHRRREIIDETAFRQRELWNDWMVQRDMAESLACNLHVDDRQSWAIHLHHSERQGAFGRQEESAFAICLDHMMRAGAIGRQIHGAHRFAGLFAELPLGIAVTDANGRVEFINRQAEGLLSGRTGVTLRAGHIGCDDSAGSARLGALVAGVCGNDLIAAGGTMIVRGGEDGIDLVVTVTPFDGPELFGLPSRRSAILVLRDIYLAPAPGLESHLQDLFGLTGAEARLSVSLTSGMTLQEAAAKQVITFKTARTYLERIFSKTATRQQSQLVSLVKASRPLF